MNPTFQDQDRGEYYYYSQQIDVHHQLLTSNPITVSKGESAMAKKKKRQKGEGVRLSTDPQSVAARERRHRISHRLKTLQSMVPGAGKMDTVSLLDHAIHYVHFLNSQIRLHQFLLLSNYSDVASPLLPVTVPDYPFLLPPPDYANGCCFGDADEALPLWPDAGAFEDEGCYCSGGSTSTLNF